MYFTYEELRVLELETRVADTYGYSSRNERALESARRKLNKELDKRETKNKNLKSEYNKKL